MLTYRAALDYLYSFTNYEIQPADAYAPDRFNLDRVRGLLARLDHPEQKFPAIHIAGTKGKGSTAALCESILRAAGYHTALYTSPHLHTFRERIRTDGHLIADTDVATGVQKIQPLAAAIPGITTFELITALAFDYFAARHVDIAVVEVGLGGRLDATNVITPRVSVITPVSFDHTAILGNTLAKIAREKAGIIKPRVPVVLAPQAAEAREVILSVAREKEAKVVEAEKVVKLKAKSQRLEGQTFDFALDTLHLPDLFLPLLGRFQLVNAATALAALMELHAQGFHIAEDAIRQGLARVQWHGRFEVLSQNPFLVADSAMNAASARALVSALDAFFPHTRVHLIFGASSDKDIRGMLQELVPRASSLILTRSRNPRAADPQVLADLAAPALSLIAVDMPTALDLARQRAESNDAILATGSSFVAAEIRALVLAERGVPVESD